MKSYKTIDGNEACALASYMFTEIATIYPITPSSPMAEHIDDWSLEGKTNIFDDTVKVVEMQSEAGAAGAMHGALRSGCLTSTYTASQGLLLMIPNMYKIAGELLPGVIHVASRSLATHALSILGDHQDIYATRQTGFAMMSSSNVQEAHDLAIITHLSALKSSIPFLHFFDGFRTSHELNKIEILEKEDILDLVDYDDIAKFRNKALNINDPKIYGTAQNDDVYFQATEVRNKYYDNTSDIVNNIMKEFNEKFDKNYKPFEYYGNKNAERIIVAMGSVCDTIKLTIDDLNKKNYKVGLVVVHLYRPFSEKYLLDVIPSSVKQIAVLDRTKEPGSVGEPLYLDIVSAIKNKNIEVIGGRYGLSSKNTTPAQIKAVYDFLAKDHFNNFTIGIDDDVTNRSLKIDDKYKIDEDNISMLIYGYGSDGMISASKTLLKIVGDNTSDYVQGYFQYDSKKSGGVTKSHLRFSKDIIRNTYYVDNPDIVVVSKESYLKKYDVLDNIKDNGIFLLNTRYEIDELDNYLPDNVKRIINRKNLRFYIINAHELSNKYNLHNKINTAISSAIFKITDMLDYEFVKKELKNIMHKMYSKKSIEIVKNNSCVIEEAEHYIKLVDNSTLNYEYENRVEEKDMFELMTRAHGDIIPVSEFLDSSDGSFSADTTKREKRCASDNVPHWIKENCIECNQCSLVCPHAVIRPYIIDESEANNMPEYILDNTINLTGKDASDYKFSIGISIKDCTGCMLCVNVCPGKNKEKALYKSSLNDELSLKEDKRFDYLDKNISEKNIFNKFTIRGSQFEKTKFQFSGACAGCGETPYIKLLTQLYGERLIIANATGCSSIYGASSPSMPYSIPWANSLFEDNAEFGYGILLGNKIMRNRVAHIMRNNLNNIDDFTNSLFVKWLDNPNDYENTKHVYDKLKNDLLPEELKPIKDFIPSRSIWTIGGDGWAYDIGYGGVDHVLSTNEKVRILVLDTELYSNTGGQASKSTNRGAVAKFACSGKKTYKKDLIRQMLSYKNCYVATISLGANMAQAIKAIKQAEEYDGPSIVIAYSPCISHGIRAGMSNSINEEKLAVECGYFPLLRYNPDEDKVILDYKNPNFDLYDEFINNEVRYKMLKSVNEKNAQELLEETKQDAINRFNYYKMISENGDIL